MVEGVKTGKTDLRAVKFPEEFRAGARNAVTTCLRIQPSEKVTLITDEATREIAASIATELEGIGCSWNGFVLEELAQRPLKDMPAPCSTTWRAPRCRSLRCRCSRMSCRAACR